MNPNDGKPTYAAIATQGLPKPPIPPEYRVANNGNGQLSGVQTPVMSGHLIDATCMNSLATQGSETKSNKRKLWIATGLALLFFATELVAGYFANSLALMSDAFHLLTDVASFVVALAALYLAEKPATLRHSFGFHRAEVIAALGSVFTIWVLTFFLVNEAIQRIRNPQYIDAKIMCITAAVGVLVNIALAFILGGHTHGHSHGGHSHDHGHNDEAEHAAQHLHADGHVQEDHGQGHEHVDEETGLLSGASKKKTVMQNINLRAAALHVVGDLLASIGVLISSIILLFDPSKTIVDPICTFIFSLLVLYTTYHLVKDSLAVLMEGTPHGISPEEVTKALYAIDGVVLVHDLHIWNLTVGKPSLTVHLQIAQPSPSSTQQKHGELDAFTYNRILSTAQRLICDEFQIHHSTIQIEWQDAGEEAFWGHCRPMMCSSRNSSGTDLNVGNVPE